MLSSELKIGLVGKRHKSRSAEETNACFIVKDHNGAISPNGCVSKGTSPSVIDAGAAAIPFTSGILIGIGEIWLFERTRNPLIRPCKALDVRSPADESLQRWIEPDVGSFHDCFQILAAWSPYPTKCVNISPVCSSTVA